MAGYPTLTDIEIAWRTSGSGLCVIVEGETGLDDPWFYQQWFGNDARRFTFFPQDGWEKVEQAVAALRTTLGEKKVYGIRDRDFAPLIAGQPFLDFLGLGICLTPKYTLENYLLDPKCWLSLVRPYNQRTPKPGWNNLAEAKTTLTELYQQCLPLSAYNWILKKARGLNRVAFTALPEKDRIYKEHPKALANLDVPAHLRNLQAQMSLANDLSQMYSDQLAVLQSMPFPGWEEVVSGKYVLKLLQENFPLKLSGQKAWDDMLGAYMNQCPDPPDDLKNILDLIWEDSQSP